MWPGDLIFHLKGLGEAMDWKKSSGSVHVRFVELKRFIYPQWNNILLEKLPWQQKTKHLRSMYLELKAVIFHPSMLWNGNSQNLPNRGKELLVFREVLYPPKKNKTCRPSGGDPHEKCDNNPRVASWQDRRVFQFWEPLGSMIFSSKSSKKSEYERQKGKQMKKSPFVGVPVFHRPFGRKKQ